MKKHRRRPALWLGLAVLACLLLAGCGQFPPRQNTVQAAPLTPSHRRITTSRRIRQGSGWVTRRTLTYVQDGRRITVTWDEPD